MAGASIAGVAVTRPDVLREVDAAALAARAAGATIARVWRRAKLVVLDLDTADRLVVQPRFTGALLLELPDRPLPEREARFSTLALALADGRRLHYRDIRRLGTVALMDAARFAAYTGALGPEPLDPAFDVLQLAGLVRSSRQAVKKVLMDQRRVVGIGNIYANEALWRARVHPARPARSLGGAEVAALHAAVVAVLEQSIRARGTSFRDYRDAGGGQGGFQHHLAAYGRGGQPCHRCGTPLAASHAIDGRSTVWCERCQPSSA